MSVSSLLAWQNFFSFAKMLCRRYGAVPGDG
jgi:hypothetical protein